LKAKVKAKDDAQKGSGVLWSLSAAIFVTSFNFLFSAYSVAISAACPRVVLE
jgi:hypothetical protein